MNKKLIIGYWPLIVFALGFLVLGFLGENQIYHQDEYRWATIANPAFNSFQAPHPPFTKYLLRYGGELVGYDHLRILILTFGLLNLFLIFLIAKELGSLNAAYTAVVLFFFNIYSLIAALQIDIDGAVLPFFVLLTYFAYLKLMADKRKKIWLVGIILGLIGGLLTKLSYVIGLAAIAVDYVLNVYDYGRFSFKEKIKQVSTALLILAAALISLYLFYASKNKQVIDYAEHFRILNFGSRAYFELAFKLIKSVAWLSPLLFWPTLFGLFDREIVKKYRFWFIYLFLNLIFYLVLFDFTNLTIERYFMFSIAPTAIIGGALISKMFKGFNFHTNKLAMISLKVGAAALTYLILEIPVRVLPLNPKGAYLESIRHLDFRFLIPFSGGSGPIGFYISANYILLAWLLALLFWALAVFPKNHRQTCLVIFTVIGLTYNLVFIEEYLFGRHYGSPDKVAKAALNYVNTAAPVKEVITYNDIGAYQLKLNSKYLSRFYTAPSRDYTKKLSEFRGHYLIVDFPEIDKTGRYWPLIAQCPVIKDFRDKEIKAYIFDCSTASLDKVKKRL